MKTFSREHSILSNYKNAEYELLSNNMVSYNDIEE